MQCHTGLISTASGPTTGATATGAGTAAFGGTAGLQNVSIVAECVARVPQ